MAYTDTKTVILEGFLGEKYGRNWNIVADTHFDIFACIEANYPGFRKDIVDMYVSGADISVQVGDTFMENVEDFLQPIGKDTIIITPIAVGSKSGPAKILAAIVIVTAMMFIPGSQFAIPAFLGPEMAAAANLAIINIGINLAITGLQQLMAPDPSVDQNDTNYLFNGPENTVVAGNPVPVLCGEMMVGGIVISSGAIGSTLSNDATYVGDGLPGPSDVPNVFYGFDAFNPPAFDTLSALQQAVLAEEMLKLRYLGEVN
jgi:predicted phage tail protein